MNRLQAMFCLSICLLASSAFSKGSKSPKPQPIPPPPIKFLSSVNEIKTGNMLATGADELKFAHLLEEQFEHSLAVSKGFVVLPRNLLESQFQMNTSIIGFELISNKGARFGFSPIETFLPIGLDFNVGVKTILLTLKMEAIDPMSGRIVASVMSKSTYKDKNSSFGLSYLSFIQASFVSSSQTPLSAVTGTALKNGANMLSDKLRHLRWQGLVTDNFREGDHHLIEINGGFDVGVEEGMIFEILGANGSSQGRVKGLVEIYRVDTVASWGRVIALNREFILEPIDHFDFAYYLPTGIPMEYDSELNETVGISSNSTY